MEISSVLPILSAVVTVCSIPVTLHIIHQHKRKKFKDDLENFTEYFEKFYKNTSSELPILLRDKAAQNLTRTPRISAEVIDYIINLHEQRLVKFDILTDHYHWGNRYIKITLKNDQMTFSKNWYICVLTKIFLYFIYYLMAFFSGFLCLDIINLSSVSWFDPLIGIASFICAIFSLNKADDMGEALKFLNIINNAQESIQAQQKIETDLTIDLAS
ncbi:hypothetical protein GCM10023345_27310 [Acinetobacter kookii]|uniref:SMODS and SLOG-associating 2TM effector domain-containing protein n=1 Tax=Acinetobacter kookii TaxID=1226327 RepID=A0A1G6KUD4_9GAMM|nr:MULTISPECIES: hypothetical protein [Acinetobacter]SDC34095.1 hypothetical protein SAMN05421732_105126 [Acinetobacter kookii]